ncbi:response regulator receiver protein [Amycolatopsis sp. EV170708-02-1]|uniref:response regulator receiver protein n=1 Tax=Amycolatopsis sp. EV170708-02-1 TaxID=2919322 RepID=UPI001F0BB992|nr:response regulator receiver protein [Amycolatopsis sp. EV170708-02-1]UMP04878.1 response regulator receiver protein [Amycolatopsis sp. EV170708-02-1]
MVENEGAVAGERAPEQARCGFRKCREPLPPPGPRGGRPYEFCPDRTWPGGKSCKQLAAAEQALREALGDDAVPSAALLDAGQAFDQAAAALTDPLRTLSNALDAVTAHLRDEIAAAVGQADAAHGAAVEADRQRDAALARAAEAEAEAEAALGAARTAQLAESLAKATADEAVEARAAAQLAQAKAESATVVITRRVKEVGEEAAALRTRADELAATLSARSEELATRTAERDAAQTALAESDERRKTWERLVDTQKRELTAELDVVRGELRDQDVRHREALAEQTARDMASREQLADVQAELTTVREQLAAAQLRLTQSQAVNDQTTATLSRIRQRALVATEEPSAPLRNDLLEILLGEETPVSE